jgi:hypothetical protein
MKPATLHNVLIITVVTIVILTGCSSEQKAYKKWMETPGTANRINLDAVQKALETAVTIQDFEKRINEIYEGPHLVLMEIKQEARFQKGISVYEDVDDNKILKSETDYLLFSASVTDGHYDFHGAGAHNYYHNSGHFGSSSMFLWYILGSMSSRPYYTPMGRCTELATYRKTYRASPKYTAQQKQNSAYRKAQVTENPSAAIGFKSRIKNLES